MPDALRLSGVKAGYDETVVLNDLTFALPGRGSLALLGRNGVGKTTLLATLMGHTTLHLGQIRFAGRQIEKLPAYQRSRLGIGYVPQGRRIFPSLDVEENLSVASRPGRWTQDRVYAVFPRLAERRQHRGNQLSGGEQQMLAIGRALMGNPTLLLMDEPLEGLAPIIVQLLLEALKSLKASDESLAMILVEQHAKLALQITDDAMVLDRGQVVHFGPSAELLSKPERLAALVTIR